jgi:hypothetical protein
MSRSLSTNSKSLESLNWRCGEAEAGAPDALRRRRRAPWVTVSPVKLNRSVRRPNYPGPSDFIVSELLPAIDEQLISSPPRQGRPGRGGLRSQAARGSFRRPRLDGTAVLIAPLASMTKGAAMIAPRIAKPQIKAAESPASTLATRRSTAVARPFGVWGREAGGGHEQEAQPALDREAPRRLDWSLSGISILSPDAPRPAAALSRPPAGTLQAKLGIGSVDDPLEHEADRVAEQVMRMADPALSISSGSPQISRKCGECEEEDKKKLQTKPAEAAKPVGEAPRIVHDVIRSSGRPLDRATRGFFEPRFGRGFSDVRVHVDAEAAASARAVNARAYTVGHDIVFGQNHYGPRSSEGKGVAGPRIGACGPAKWRGGWTRGGIAHRPKG